VYTCRNFFFILKFRYFFFFMIITELNFATAADRCRPSPGGGRPSTSPSPPPPSSPSPFTVCRVRRRRRRACPSTHVTFAVCRSRSVHDNLHQWGTGCTRPKSSWRSVSERWVYYLVLLLRGRHVSSSRPTQHQLLITACAPFFFPVYFCLNFYAGQFPATILPITFVSNLRTFGNPFLCHRVSVCTRVDNPFLGIYLLIFERHGFRALADLPRIVSLQKLIGSDS